MKSIVIVAIVLLGCIAVNEALKCYSHDACSTNCPQLADSVRNCASDDNRCYKSTVATLVTRGCSKDKCDIQGNAGPILSKLCCENDLCNAATTSKMTLGAILLAVGSFVFARM